MATLIESDRRCAYRAVGRRNHYAIRKQRMRWPAIMRGANVVWDIRWGTLWEIGNRSMRPQRLRAGRETC